MNQTKRFTEEEFNECAAEITKEALAFNRIGSHLSNIWKERLLSFWILKEAKQENLPESKRIYYNLHQHSKAMEVVRKIDTKNGIEAMLNFLENVDNSRVERITEKTNQQDFQVDYAGMWDRSNAEQKLTFFKDHDESKCPTGTKWIARDYYRKLGLNVEELMVW